MGSSVVVTRYVTVVIVTILGAYVAVASAHRCYVCVPRAGGTVADVQDMFPGQIPLLKCEDFDEEDGRFVKDCPKGYAGCLTQINGSHVKRTCGDLPVNDCKIANSIQYCYCSGALCNGAPHPHPPPHSLALPSDDEDLSHDGSGGGGGGGGGGGDQTSHRAAHGKTSTSTTARVTPMTTATPTVVKSGASRTDTAATSVLMCVAVVCGVASRRQ